MSVGIAPGYSVGSVPATVMPSQGPHMSMVEPPHLYCRAGLVRWLQCIGGGVQICEALAKACQKRLVLFGVAFGRWPQRLHTFITADDIGIGDYKERAIVGSYSVARIGSEDKKNMAAKG